MKLFARRQRSDLENIIHMAEISQRWLAIAAGLKVAFIIIFLIFLR